MTPSTTQSTPPLGPPYPTYRMGPMEVLLLFLLLLVWLYALRRFYLVWSTVLNFSAIEHIGQRAGGWDAFIQWAKEHFKSLKTENENPTQQSLEEVEMSRLVSSTGQTNGIESIEENQNSIQENVRTKSENVPKLTSDV